MSQPTGTLCLKDPDASALPKGIDWTDYLAAIGDTETISTSTWTVTGRDAALTMSTPSIVTGSKKTQVLLAAGTLGVQYTLTNSIVTTPSGIHDDRSIPILIENL